MVATWGMIGAGLVIMALALSHRVNLAWGLTILLTAAHDIAPFWDAENPHKAWDFHRQQIL